MNKYCYLVAQLASLEFGKKPAIELAQFFDQAGRWLHAKEMVALNAGLTEEKSNLARSPAIKQYHEFAQMLKNELAHWRKSSASGQEYKVPAVLAPVVLAADPLLAEKNIIKAKYDFIEQQEIGYFFDLTYLVFYGLKLKLLERLFMFDQKIGQNNFTQAVTELHNKEGQ